MSENAFLHVSLRHKVKDCTEATALLSKIKEAIKPLGDIDVCASFSAPLCPLPGGVPDANH